MLQAINLQKWKQSRFAAMWDEVRALRYATTVLKGTTV